MNRWKILAEKYFERPNGNSRGENKNTVFGYSKGKYQKNRKRIIETQFKVKERMTKG